MNDPRISVIIPTYNEASAIESTLVNLLRQKEELHEVIVVDGESSDETIAIASLYAQVFQSSKGRANQMNEGAVRASGDVLVFLHADTILPQDGLSLIKAELLKGKRSGRFRMRFDSEQLSLKIFASYTRFSCFSYGDQCFFVTRELFEKMAGYRNDVAFEDVDFYSRLKKINRPVIIKQKVITSARRFLKTGSMKQKWINLLLVGLVSFGFDIRKLKERLYSDIR